MSKVYVFPNGTGSRYDMNYSPRPVKHSICRMENPLIMELMLLIQLFLP